MIVRKSHFRVSFPLISRTCIRCAHERPLRERPIPFPTPFVPDHETFMRLIGRGLSAHASKIPSWDALFTLTSNQLRQLGVEPARNRKYLLKWRERFRQGVYGIGGDLKHVKDGTGEVRVFEVPVPKEWQTNPSSGLATATRSAGMRKVALSVPAGHDTPDQPLESAAPVQHVKIRGASQIAGKFVQALKGSNGMAATIRVREGLWEEKRGHKVDGGERRQAEVRAKRAAADRKAQRA